jgi:hypothetical protein
MLFSRIEIVITVLNYLQFAKVGTPGTLHPSGGESSPHCSVAMTGGASTWMAVIPVTQTKQDVAFSSGQIAFGPWLSQGR